MLYEPVDARAVARRLAHPIKAFILAAGKGTRLRPLTFDGPKPMVPINGKPLLEHTLWWLRQHSIEGVAMNLHHFPAAIPDYFGSGESLGMHLTYSYEPRLLGTAGALRNLDAFVAGATVVVVYGDVLTDLDLTALLAYHHENVLRDPCTGVTMALYKVPNPTEVGLVDLDASRRITRFVEKPPAAEVFTDLANAGILVLEPAVIERIPAGEFFDFGLHLFPMLLAEEITMYGWVVPSQAYVLDIGTIDKYRQAEHDWASRQGLFPEGRPVWKDGASSSIAMA